MTYFNFKHLYLPNLTTLSLHTLRYALLLILTMVTPTAFCAANELAVKHIRPFSLWEAYRWQISAAIVVLMVLSGLVLWLLRLNRRLVLSTSELSSPYSKRKQTEALLQENEEKLRLFIHYSPSSIAIFDRDMRYLAYSKRWLDDYRLGGQELLGRSHYEVFPDIPERWKKLHQQSLAGSIEKCEQDMFQRADGSIDWVRWEMHPWLTSEGNVGGIILFSEVITERVTMEQAVIASEKEFRLLAEAMPQIVWVTRTDGWNIYFNQHWVDYTGLSFEESYGHGWNKPFHPDDQQRAWDAWQNAVNNNGTYAIESRLRRADGVYRWWLIRGMPVLNEQGVVYKWFGTCTDIHDIKETEKALQEKQRFLTESQAIAHVGSWLLDLNTGILSWSDETFRIYGLSPLTDKQPTAEHFFELLHSDDVFSMQSWITDCASGKQPSGLEFRTRAINGSYRWLLGYGAMETDQNGKPLRMIGTVQDITERKHSEIELAQYRQHLEELVENRTTELLTAKQAAEAANKAKSMFLANMSHELRTPLNAILGFSELMAQDDTLSAKQKENLAIINRSGAHLLSMINDVLDISKIEAGCLALEIEAFDFFNLLQDISDMIKVRAATKQLNFGLEISPAVPQYIEADSGKLRQVLINLLGNAIKFTPQGGKIILRAGSLPLSDVTKVMLEVEVTDSGMGIPEDQLDNLFKPFVQLAQNNAYEKGTGLGLAISKSLVELMGGHLYIKSVLGTGSTFKVELPVTLTHTDALEKPAEMRQVKAIAPNQPEWRLLIVDDTPDNRLLLAAILTGVGFQVREVENGQEAIQQFEQWQPHLIWMDMRMPVMDGYQAAATIRQLPGGDKVKIIAITASVFKEQRTNIIEAGCDTLIHKPFQTSEIFAALSQHLGVKFIYQDQPISVSSGNHELTPEMLDILPLHLRQQLLEAATHLDMEESDAVLAQIHCVAPDIADGLQKLAQGFQFGRIIQLVETANSLK